MVTSLEHLRKSPLFANLNNNDFQQVEAAVRYKRVAGGKPLMDANQPGSMVYFILEGSVKVFDEDSEGRLVVLALLGPSEIVGEMSVLDSSLRSASVVVQEPSLVAWVDSDTFNHWRSRMPSLSIALTELLARRLRLANAQIRALSTLDVRGRVARLLLTFAEEYGEPQTGGSTMISLRLTQSDLAGLTGSTRVRVNQTLSAWKRSGYIQLHTDYRIEIRDFAPLRRLCDMPSS